MKPISRMRLGRLLPFSLPLLSLACSATGDNSSTIGNQDITNMGGASSMAGASGTGSTPGYGPDHPLVDPNSNGAGGQMMVITQLPMRMDDPTACTKDQNILFLIDRSGSMQCNPPPTTQSFQCEIFPMRADTTMPSKLEIVESAMSMAWDQLLPTNPKQPKTRAGLAELSTDDMCGSTTTPLVPVTDVSPQFLDMMRMSLMGLVPNGTTPIVNAVNSAYQYFEMNAAALEGAKHVILVTDGADTCTQQSGIQDLINNQAPAALKMGISTWVIGAPGSENARSMLSHLAKAGGTGRPNCDVGTSPTTGNCHYDMTMGDFATSFGTALKEILAAVECGLR
jgi:hypothetical protein